MEGDVEARFSRRPLPTITGWGEVASSVASALCARHVVFMHLGSRRWRQGAGPTRVEVVGRPQSPALPPLRLVERGGRAPTPPLYKERTGATEIRTPSSLRSPRAEPRIFSWCLLPPVARLGAPFALFASLPYLLRRETRKGLRAPYLFSACKPSGLSCI